MAPILMLMLFWGIFSDQSCATEITVEELLLQNEWLSSSSIDVQDDQGYVLKTLGKEDIIVIIDDYVDSYPARQWTPSLEVGPWNKCKDVDETVNLGFKKIHIKFKACIIVEVLPNGIKVTLSAGRLTYSETITVPNPKPICHKLPGLEIVDICLALYNLNFKELSGCARIDFSVKVKTFKIDLGCFKLKQVQEEPVQRADTLSDNNLLLF
ncbi:hypothetical protein CHS0354_000060 [Potamilus streckersoni]|uniref:DUF4773 domain-containing protein n=1 Tax=Potamilus streckersoni TaxID=2493646 RepID=A0AAE0RUB8_9BIVA|nr:hypothetical protein CHS0354_000060 [Potamilus streckersoni]